MTTTKFIAQLSMLTLITIGLIIGLNFQSHFASAQSLSWSTVIIFTVFSGVVFFAASFSAKQENKHLFTNVALLVMMIKMLLSVILVAIFVKKYSPTSNHFLIPFFVIYILYTIFEVYFMTSIGKYERGK